MKLSKKLPKKTNIGCVTNMGKETDKKKIN